MAPEIFFGVCYRDFKPAEAIRKMHTFTPAVLHGYCRHKVKGADYPAIVAEENQTVRGVFVTGLTEANMEKLDIFEGDEYDRKYVKVKLLEKNGGKEVEGEEKEVAAYVFINPEAVEKGEWDYEHFRDEKMAHWIREEPIWAPRSGIVTASSSPVKRNFTTDQSS